jgi:hypothetical protein
MSYKIAGIDVHKKVLRVVVIDATTPEEKPERRRFATLPRELHRLLIWLREQGVEEAGMESTAQYSRSASLKSCLRPRGARLENAWAKCKRMWGSNSNHTCDGGSRMS